MSLLNTLILHRNDRRPTGDEERDVPPITIDLVYLTGVILFALAVLLGVFAGSVLLHTFDAEIRHALGQAWDVLQRLYWAGLNAQG